MNRIEILYRFLRGINRIVSECYSMDSNVEERFFTDICNLAVKLLAEFAWVGLFDGSKNMIIPAYYSTTKEEYKEYLNYLYIPINDEVLGKGPAATSFKQNSVVIVEDTSIDEIFRPWRDKVLKYGFKSTATLPIRKNGKVIGVFGIYSKEPNFFQEEEISLFEELSSDIELFLNNIEANMFLHDIESALSKFIDVFVITDINGNITYIGNKSSQFFGYEINDLIGKNISIFHVDEPIMYKSYYDEFYKKINNKEEYDSIIPCKSKEGYVLVNILAIPLKNGGYLCIGNDVSKQKYLEEQIYFLINQDIVTNLFSYNFLMTQLDLYVSRANEIAKSGTSEYRGALILMDIFRFSYINDIYGKTIGDKILKEVANRLRYAFRATDIISRVGGDAFGILLTDLSRKEDIIMLIDRLRKIFEKPIYIDGHYIKVSFQIGIAIFPDDGISAEDIYKKADISLTKAKQGPEWFYVFYTDELNVKVSEFLLYKNHLEQAFIKNEFVVFYQPYFDIKSLNIVGFEALTRWNSTDLGLVPPIRFIPILEETGLISRLEDWLIDTVCQDIKRLYKVFGKIPPVAVNISALSFKTEDVYTKVINITNRYKKDIEKDCINIEITESVFLEDLSKAIDTLVKFRNSGFKISLDDFGTGYSSFSYIKDLPIDNLKIDISFVRDILKDHKTKSIVKTIIELAHNLGVKTIAEGVETKEQLEALKSLSCDYVQGYLLAKPMPFNDLVEFIKSSKIQA